MVARTTGSQARERGRQAPPTTADPASTPTAYPTGASSAGRQTVSPTTVPAATATTAAGGAR